MITQKFIFFPCRRFISHCENHRQGTSEFPLSILFYIISKAEFCLIYSNYTCKSIDHYFFFLCKPLNGIFFTKFFYLHVISVSLLSGKNICRNNDVKLCNYLKK